MDQNDVCKPLSLLTVGDGDLSASLAILRAYENSSTVLIKEIVATTLLSSNEELIETYPTSAESILEELEASNSVTILFQVDATQLHKHPELQGKQFDLVLFHHPHLGYNEAISSDEHIARHSSLLAHYLDSAQAVLAVGGLVHLCLCLGAVQSWRLHEMVQHLKMDIVVQSAASKPLLEPVLEYLQENLSESTTTSNLPNCSSKSRRGHWLGRYGYRHQPTFPHVTEFQTNVSSSCHFFVRPTKDREFKTVNVREDGSAKIACPICLLTCEDPEALELHLQAPALPLST